MAKDPLEETLNELLSRNSTADLYQAVQAGYTAGAVSMRTRAMAQVDKYGKDQNAVKNAIGSLPDITEG